MTNHGATGELDAVVERWHDVCRHDPLLPRTESIVDPEPLVAIVLDLLRRQGDDTSDLEHAARAFAARNTPLEVAVEELVCLAEAVRPQLEGEGDDERDAEWRLRDLPRRR